MTFFGKRRNNTLIDQQVSFRSEENRSKRRKQRTWVIVRLISLFLVGIFIVGLLIRLPGFYSKVAKPFNSLESKFYSQGQMDFSRRTNVLLLTVNNQELQEIALASIESGKKKIEILKISPKTKVPGQEGIRDLRELINNKNGSVENIDLISAAVLEITGYWPEAYILVSDDQNWLVTEQLNDLVNKAKFSPQFFLNFSRSKEYLDSHLSTNLSLEDFYDLTTTVKKVLPERFHMIDTSGFLLDSGFIDQKALNNEIGVKLNDAKITEGNFAVEIVNSSGIEGLGQVAKNFISNLGANVVSVDSGEVREKKSQVLFANKNNDLVKRLEKLFITEAKSAEVGSVDIKLIIGEDFGKFFQY